MLKKVLMALMGLAGMGVTAAGLGLFLERNLAYRSPLAGPQPAWIPREQALADLAELEAKLAEEKAAAEKFKLRPDLTTEEMVELGREIVHDKGMCLTCHTVGTGGGRAPDLEGVGARAGERIPGMSDLEYLSQSLYDPEAFFVPEYTIIMTPVNEAPMNLTEDEILMVVAYLQSLGGTPTVTPETVLPFGPGGKRRN